MLEKIPSESTMTELLGQSLFAVWQELCSVIDEKYDMERLWNTGGKNWTYEYKYRRGGKTLCSLYAKNNCIGLDVYKRQKVTGSGFCGAEFSSVCFCLELRGFIGTHARSK